MLIGNGYIKKGLKYLHPDSESKIPGVQVCLNCKDDVKRVYSHGGDVLNDSHAHDAFDCYRLLECGGDWKKALRWSDAINKHNTEVWKREQLPIIEIDTSGFVVNKEKADIQAVEPFPGLMAEMIESILTTAHKPQPELTTLAVLIGMAAAIPGHYMLPGDGRLNLYGTGISGTGTGKEHPRHGAELIAEACGCNVVGKPGSGAGLEDLLEPNKNLLLGIDEIAHLLEALEGSNKPPYLIDLSGNLLKLFTQSKGTYRTRPLAKTKGFESAKSIQHPCVSLIGFATPEKLGKAASVSSIEDGLLGRVLFAMGRDDVPPRRGLNQFMLNDAVLERAQHINSINGGFVQEVHITIDPIANSRLDSVLLDFDTSATQATTLFSRALKMRSYEKCERIAGVLAVWDDPQQPVVNVDHVQWAARFVNLSDATVTKFCADFMHNGQVQADAALILKTMKRTLNGELKPQKANEAAHIKAGRLPWSFILRATKQLDKKAFDCAIAYLVDMNEVESCERATKELNGREYKTKLLMLL